MIQESARSVQTGRPRYICLWFGKIFRGLKSSSFYDVRILQEEIRKALDSKGMSRDTYFSEGNVALCKV
jgi:hypothetical protein